MENGSSKKWIFRGNEVLRKASEVTIRGVLNKVMANLDDEKPKIVFGHGDPSSFPCFRTTPVAEDAIVDSLKSAKHNNYAPTVGVLEARKAIANYASRDLPYCLSPDSVFITAGALQGIEALITVLARPGANILLPRPAYPLYEARATYSGLEVRHYNLLPENGWEADLDAVEALADENTCAIVVINPGNPCGNVVSYQHLKKIAETASKLGIMVIADEVYGHLTFGANPFVPMGVFNSIVPIITLGALSKRWVVPGWRLGWLIANDHDGVLQKSGIIDCLKGFLDITSDPATFIQGAVPQILEKTSDEFFSQIVGLLKEISGICYERVKEIPAISCPSKPEGSMFVMMKLNLGLLDGISDDVDFCLKLAKEENVAILPGVAVGLKNWLRITYAVDLSSLQQGLDKLKLFCQRHASKTLLY